MNLGGIVAPEAVPGTVPGSSGRALETTLGGRGIAGQGAVPETVPGNKEMHRLQESVHALETTPGGTVAPEAALKIAPGDKPAKNHLQGGSGQVQEIIPERIVSLEAVQEKGLRDATTKMHHQEAVKHHVLARGLVLETGRVVRILHLESHPQMQGKQVHLQFLRGQ